MKLLTVRHATKYSYARPVAFGRHRLMLRPRDSHDLRLVGAELTLSPPGNVRWMHDVFGNSVALVDFQQPGTSLTSSARSRSSAGHRGPVFPVAPEAEYYPFIYSSSDCVDLGRLLEQHFPDPGRRPGALGEEFRHLAADAHARSAASHERSARAHHRLWRTARGRHAIAARNAAKANRRLPRLRTDLHRSRALSRLRRALRLRLSLRSGARQVVPATAGRPRRRMPGRKSICLVPAGSNTIRPTC